jgi:DNA-binding transcriptional LysR family regulator
VRLTEAGEALVRHTEAILNRLSEAEAELEAIAGLRGERLRMASFESAAATLMPPAIADFRAGRPGVELSLIIGEPRDMLPLLKSGALDLLIAFDSRVRGEVDGISRQHLISDPLFLVVPADHPHASKRHLRIADFADDAWVAGTTDCECSRLIMRACTAAGFEPRIEFETDDYTATQSFVAAGVGVSLIAGLGLTNVRDDIVIRDLGRATPVREIYAATPAGGHHAPAAQAMLESLRRVAARYETRRPSLSGGPA